MTDSELLMAAADAAGLQHTGEVFALGLKLMSGRHEYWNPLGNDGEALRLAVKLGLSVDTASFSGSYSTATQPFGVETIVLHNSDALAATRRAIVTTAAQIGVNLA